MKKERATKKTALELKLARIRKLSTQELVVAQGGRCPETEACNTGSCNNTGTC